MRNRRLLAAALILGAALAAPGVASADQKAVAANLPVASDSTNLGSYEVERAGPAQVFGFNFHVYPKVTWTGNFQPDRRLGDAPTSARAATCKVTRSSPIVTGQLKVSWNITGGIVLVNKVGFGEIINLNTSATADCLPLTYGDTMYSCTATSDPLTVFRSYGVPFSPYAKVVLKAKFSITPEGAIVDRKWSVPDSNDTGATKTGLGLGLGGIPEVVKVPCSAGAGLPFYYKLLQPAVRAGRRRHPAGHGPGRLHRPDRVRRAPARLRGPADQQQEDDVPRHRSSRAPTAARPTTSAWCSRTPPSRSSRKTWSSTARPA